MTAADIDAIYQSAEAEFDRGEEVMLITPVALMGLIDQLRRCERLRHEAGRYDIVSEPAEPG